VLLIVGAVLCIVNGGVFNIAGHEFHYFSSGNYAMGIFAAGTFSIGIFSAGIFSIGIFSIGIFNVGLYALGFFVLAWKKKYPSPFKKE
jgi:quaternary ammonium compound-resistance protein SugE